MSDFTHNRFEDTLRLGLSSARTRSQCGTEETESTLVLDGIDDGPPICEHCVLKAASNI